MENNTPEEQLNQKMWRFLQQIKEAELLKSSNEPLEFLIRKQKDILIDEQRKLLYKLANLEAIKINKQFACIEVGLSKIMVDDDLPNIQPNGFHLEILPKFKEIYEEFKNKTKKIQIPKETVQKVSLKSQKIRFDDDQAMLQIGKQNVSMPPYKNEHYFCRAMFEYLVKEPIDWSIIYPKITHKELEYKDDHKTKQEKRMVQDTLYRINNRIKKIINTNDALFHWQGKTIQRNY